MVIGRIFNSIAKTTEPTKWQQINVLPQNYNFRRRMFVNIMGIALASTVSTIPQTLFTWDGHYIENRWIGEETLTIFGKDLINYPVVKDSRKELNVFVTRGVRTGSAAFGFIASICLLIRIKHDEEMEPIREAQLSANYNLAAQMIGLQEHAILAALIPPEEKSNAQFRTNQKVKSGFKINIGYFDPRLLKNHKDYPHISVRGKTRSGKTWSTMKILKVLGGCQIIIAPKLNPQNRDWHGYTIIHHADADQAPIKGAEVVDSLTDRLNQAFENSEKIIIGTGYEYSAIIKTMQWCIQIMRFCQKNRDFHHAPIQLVFDDVNTYSEVIPAFGVGIKELAIMAADADIRIWGLSHLLTANAYGLKKGDAGILSNFVNVNIGGMAIRQAQLLFNKALDQQEATYYQACVEYLKKSKKRERCLIEVDGLGYVLNYQQLDTLQEFDDGKILPLPDMYSEDENASAYIYKEEIVEEIEDENEDLDEVPPQKAEPKPEPKKPEIDQTKNQNFWDELLKPSEGKGVPESADDEVKEEGNPAEENPPEPSESTDNKEFEALGSTFTPLNIQLFCEKYQVEEELVLKGIQYLIYMFKKGSSNIEFDGHKTKVLKTLLLVRGRKFSDKGDEIWESLIKIIHEFVGGKDEDNNINLEKD